MRLQDIFETTEEDRALISLSSAIYTKLQDYVGSDQPLVHLGKIGDMFDTPVNAMNNISVDLQQGDDFIERAKDDKETLADYVGKDVWAFFEEDTETIVVNIALLDKHRMRTTITHELRHALDKVKSGSFPGDAKGYFTPRKKEHRPPEDEESTDTIHYRAQPAEINARFVEILDVLAKRIPQWYAKLAPDQIKPQLTKDFNNMLVKMEIADIFPERTKSSDYKRLVKRAYDFMQKEMTHIESQLAKNGNPKVATGSF